MTQIATVTPTAETLVPLIARYRAASEAIADGWVFSGDRDTPIQVGEEALVWSYDALRRGLVTKVARKRVTVAFTTAGAVTTAARADEASRDVRIRLDTKGELTEQEQRVRDLITKSVVPRVTAKSDLFDAVMVRPSA